MTVEHQVGMMMTGRRPVLNMGVVGFLAMSMFLGVRAYEGTCQDGWSLYDGDCYRVFTNTLPWEDASAYCKSYGSNLVSLPDDQATQHIGNMIYKRNNQHTVFWTGLSRKNIENDTTLEGKWEAGKVVEDVEAAGVWMADQPDYTKYDCVQAARIQESSYGDFKFLFGFHDCDDVLPFVCMRDSCENDTFPCADGKRCLFKNLTCNGIQECSDGSDEIDCPANCHHFFDKETGIIESPGYPNDYPASAQCLYTIQGPPGSNIQLKFSDFSTEAALDLVEVYVGATVVADSTHLVTLSGDVKFDHQMSYISPNNLMILQFSSDKTNQSKGFRASYKTSFNCTMNPMKGFSFEGLPVLQSQDNITTKHCVDSCIATAGCNSLSFEPVSDSRGNCKHHATVALPTKMDGRIAYVKNCPNTIRTNELERDEVITLDAERQEKSLRSPFFPLNFVPCSVTIYKIKGRMVTLNVDFIDLGEEDSLDVIDGDDIKGLILATFKKDSEPQRVVSTERNMYLYYYACSSKAGRGFTASYKEGCNEDYEDVLSGVLTSPRYPQEYPNRTFCTVNIKAKDERPFSIMFDDKFELADDRDTLDIYDGKNQAASSLLDVQGKSSTAPTMLYAASGSAHIRFRTLSTRSAAGYKVTFSVDCPPVSFNFTSTNTSNRYMAKFNVSCIPGYQFDSQEYVNQTSVYMECLMGGSWNRERPPRCAPVRCGFAPSIEHGTPRKAGGPNVASYRCEEGYSVSFNTSIKCQDNGEWETPPRCQPATCIAIGDLQNGEKNIMGNETIYGAQLNFTCDDGYDLIGSPRLLCTSSGWSDLKPTCRKLRCPRVKVLNGFMNFTANYTEFDDEVNVVCNTGYELVGNATSKCLAYRTYDNMASCQDINECNTTKPCNQMCTNTEGSFTCSCSDGYRFQNGSTTTCIDINECTEGTDNCDEDCSNSQGGYSCGCSSPGKVLFTSDGVQGHKIPTSENGNMHGDQFHVNHTCVKKQCPTDDALLLFPNGNIIGEKDMFHYGDNLTYACDIGYRLDGEETVSCLANGSWSDPAPKCIGETCSKVSENPSEYTLSSSDAIPFEGVLNITCFKNRPVPLIKHLTCSWDPMSKTYILMGGTPDCNNTAVDCGIPSPSDYSGCDISPSVVTDTFYLSTFTLSAKDRYQLKGTSKLGNSTVTCMANGNWDFGDIQCIGEVCEDPGRGPGTRQMATSYKPGNPVSYQCIRPGYDFSSTTPLNCRASNASWDRVPPTCSDTEKPEWTNNKDVCSKTFYVTKFSTVASTGFKFPDASDNTAINTMVVDPSTHLQEAITEDFNVTITVTDFNNNEISCHVSFIVKDEYSPELTCTDLMVTVDVNGTVIDHTLLLTSVSVTDNVTPVGDINVTISRPLVPQSVNLTNANMHYTAMASATDGSGNEAQCRFTVAVRAKTCTPPYLQTPRNGKKTCVETNTGYECTMSCDSGYSFRDAATQAENKIYTCNHNGGWNLPEDIPSCVVAEKPVFREYFIVSYNMTGSVYNSTTCDYSSIFNVAVETVRAAFTERCSKVDNIKLISMMLNDTRGDQVLDVHIMMEIENNTLSDDKFIFCSMAIVFAYNNIELPGSSAVALLTPSVAGTTCPGLVFLSTTNQQLAYTSVNKQTEFFKDHFQCPSGKKLRVEADENQCLPCSAGSYVSGDTCIACPKGQYQSLSGQSSCISCPEGQFTYNEGAVDVSECQNTCSPGTFSATQLEPCNECALGKYSFNASHCESCSSSPPTTTRQRGAVNVTFCVGECSPGEVSFDGYLPCKKCPRGFYQGGVGQQMCTACPHTNQTTPDIGMTSVDNCTDECTLSCGNGSCHIINHVPRCMCSQGYHGEFCGSMIDYCESSPCYYNGTCTSVLNGFNCSCPDGASGLRCEIDEVNCKNHSCLNNGMCQDLPFQQYKCLCQDGFGGKLPPLVERCNETRDICTVPENACNNGGTCASDNNLHSRCECLSGYSGRKCEIDINECDSQPCFHNGNCTQGVDSYTCGCMPQFTGSRCEYPVDLCLGNPCGSGSTCHVNHLTLKVECRRRELPQNPPCEKGQFYHNGWCYSITKEMAGADVITCPSGMSLATIANSEENEFVKALLLVSSKTSAWIQYTRLENGSWPEGYVDWVNTTEAIPGHPMNCTYVTKAGWTNAGCSDAHTHICEKKAPGDFLPNGYMLINQKTCTGNVIHSLSAGSVGDCSFACDLNPDCVAVSHDGVGTCNLVSSCSQSVSVNGFVHFKTAVGLFRSYPGTCQDATSTPSTSVTVLQCAITCWADSSCLRFVYEFDSGSCRHESSLCTNPIQSSTVYTCLRVPEKPDNYDMLVTPVDHCKPDPCQNGTCSSNVFGYSCSCDTGFTGRQCQHDIDQCKQSHNCDHGECVDLPGAQGFKCSCQPGWNGARCDNNINDCTSCSSRGSCSDLVNDYKCTCQQGYTGKDCERQIDECAQYPCKHDSECKDMLNDYQCTCKSGWSGKNCDQQNSTACVPNPCGMGTCLHLFGPLYYCLCPVGTEGNKCEKNVSICENTDDPCSSHGQCSEKNGRISCRCDEGYIGENCETKVDYCRKCQGDCKPQSKAPFFKCDCPIGYEGMNCEHVKDYCKDMPCPGQRENRSICYNLMDGPMCFCQSGKEGADCNKDADTDFSLVINSPDDTGFASSGSPFLLNTRLLSISVGCRFQEQNGKGTIYNLLTSDENRRVTSEGWENSLTINELGVHIYLAGKPTWTIEFTDATKINDGQWHIILFILDTLTGKGTLMVDGTKVNSDPESITPFTFPKWGFTGFGSKYDPKERKPVPGSGFRGSLGNCNIWKKILGFNSPEYISLLNNPKKAVALDSLLRGWYGLRLGGGCTRTKSSTVQDPVCADSQYINPPTCDQRAPDFTPPTIDYCPESLQFIMRKRISAFTWKEPEFSGYSGSIYKSHFPGISLFFLGKSRNAVTYVAHDKARNKAKCKFVVYLKGGCSGVLIGGICLSVSSTKHAFGRARVECEGQFSVLQSLLASSMSSSDRNDLAKYLSSTYNGTVLLGVTDQEKEGEFKDTLGKVVTIPSLEGNDANKNCVVMNSGNFSELTIVSCNEKSRYICRRKVASGENCQKPKDPKHGKLECKEKKHGVKCKVVCDAGYKRHGKHAKYIQCGRLGQWQGRKHYRVPSCGPKRAHRRRYQIIVRYNFPISCQTTIRDRLRVLFLAQLVELRRIWPGLCRNKNCQSAVSNLDCAGRRVRRAAENGSLTVDLSDIEPMLNNTDNTETKSAEDILKEAFMDNSTNLDFSSDVAGAVPVADQTVVTSEPDCPAGQVFNVDTCVECSAGSYFNNLTKECTDCAVGEYQADSGQFSCISCGQGSTTDSFGSTDVADCQEVCQPGSYFSGLTQSCKVCPVGYYQDKAGQFACTPCDADKTTASTNSSSASQCFEDCKDGYQLQGDGSCSKCERGTYRQRGVNLVCESCPAGKITPGNGSVTVAECNVTACRPGEYLDGNNECKNCEVGSYQPEKWQTSCISCGDSYRTSKPGQEDISYCYFYCEDGYEQSSSLNCTKCPVGKYRSNEIDGYETQLCLSCSPSPANVTMVTAEEAATHADNCTVLDCPGGQKADEKNEECVACPLGEYQPNIRKTSCIPCGTGNSTRTNGTVTESGCEAFCAAGYEKNSTGQCEKCDIGYFKENDDFKFNMCTMCDVEFITAGEGSTNQSDCSVKNCSAGSYLKNPENTCELCPLNEWQDQKWQTSCNNCPTDKSTRNTGQISASQCYLNCSIGKEEKDSSGNCTECLRGYYKDSHGVDACTICPEANITAGSGATHVSDCNIANCTEGYYLDVGSNTCKQCDEGKYQDEKWQTSCKSCPNTTDGKAQTTFNKGAASADVCVLDCPSGYEFVAGRNSCQICAQAFYRDEALEDTCQACPGNNITESNATVSVSLCNLPNCTEGEYIDSASKTCKPCDKGSYQDTWWQMKCKPCPADNGRPQTTFVMGANSSDVCVLDCPSGEEFDNANSCKVCPQAYYRDKAVEDKCLPCPGNNITESNRTISVSLCNLPNCTEGEYIDVASKTCKPCDKGSYQDTWWQMKCKPCPNAAGGEKQTTFVTGSKNTDNCLLDCESGYEFVAAVGSQGSCQICEIGFYRNKTLEDTCLPCSPSLITAGNGTTSVDGCNLGNCTAGNYAQGTTCKPCEIGSFQPKKWQTSCTKCQTGYTTQIMGQTEDTCLRNCPDGEESDKEDKSKCVKCPQGSYRNMTLGSLNCTICPNDRMTPTNGSINVGECIWGNCKAGEFIDKNMGFNCTKCPNGEYQSKPLQMSCEECPVDQDTEGNEGSTSKSACKLNCPAGKEDVDTNCTECARGFYKSLQGTQSCTECPLDKITAGIGSMNISQCNVANCSEGYYRDNSSNTCKVCEKGQFQDEKWQTSCKVCPNTAGGQPQTTFNEGATSSAVCVLDCASGTELDGASSCKDCERGYYRNKSLEDSCMPCTNGHITPADKADSVNECKIANCTMGEFRNVTSNTCTSCDKGTFQDEKWQDSCKSCPNSASGLPQTSFVKGATSNAVCVLDCASGSEYVAGSPTCKTCAQGTHRDKAVDDSCQPCPGNVLTGGTGATSVADCNLANCTAGQRSVNGKCEECPPGTYQPDALQRECKPCALGYTTKNASQVDDSACIRDCEAGKMVSRTDATKCEPCVQGFYRNKSESFECLQCPTGWITPGLEYTSVNYCTWADCGAGSFIDKDNNYNCTKCPNGYYQEMTRQTKCKQCGVDMDTAGLTGSVSNDACVSTDECRSTDFNNCDQNAKCTNTPTSYTCACNEAYSGNGTHCRHVCEIGSVCKNGASCLKATVSPGYRCQCTEDYIGDTCTKLAPVAQSQTPYIIGFSIGSVIFLLLLILLILGICHCLRKKQQKDIMEDSFRNPAYATPLPSVKNTSLPMLNPAAGPVSRSARSLYDSKNSSAYMFYEDKPNEPLKPFESSFINNAYQPGPRSGSVRPIPNVYDEQEQSIEFIDEDLMDDNPANGGASTAFFSSGN